MDFNFNNGKKLRAVEGDIVFLKPDDAYVVSCSEVCQHFTVNFQIEEKESEGSIVEKILNDNETTCLHKTSSTNYYGDNLGKLCGLRKKKDTGCNLYQFSIKFYITLSKNVFV